MQPLEIVALKGYIPVLFPEGSIGYEQIKLLLIIQGIMLLVVIPVFILTFYFSWKYRAGQSREKYDPHMVDHKGLEVIWWGVPFVLVSIIAVLTVIKTYELDPFKPIGPEDKTLTVEVVATQWNWLFIYPEQGIASLNYLAIPKGTPVHFKITSDAPMNAFWIPELGGMIYAMPKMLTELHLIADKEGQFLGRSANISGEGFADMQFTTKSQSEEDFKAWVQSVKSESKGLNFQEYNEIAKPTPLIPAKQFTVSDPDLFHKILTKFMKKGS
ncbi:MAG: ubiquinol oxidase subunit II [Chlamydiia bacterium]|nr:ubiquinol oxidase subunit II [Chlamydiia bacterium]